MSKLYVVHCVDTEGPMDESIEDSFQRIKEITGIELVPSLEILDKLYGSKNRLPESEELYGD